MTDAEKKYYTALAMSIAEQLAHFHPKVKLSAGGQQLIKCMFAFNIYASILN